MTSPLWLIAVLGIKISDPGPVFYMARRVGKDNREFRMFKFRSMRVDRDADESSFKADTNRVFPFGAFLRASKIDELPQLLNCFLGDMAIIGPRPASKDQVSVLGWKVFSSKYCNSAIKVHRSLRLHTVTL